MQMFGSRNDKLEQLDLEWTELNALWQRVRDRVNEPEKSEITELFKRSGEAKLHEAVQWKRFYEAELRIIRHLDASELIPRCEFVIAKFSKETSAFSATDVSFANEQLNTARSLPGSTTALQDLYASLLGQLYEFYVVPRMERRLRRRAAGQLTLWGLSSMILAAVAAGLGYWWIGCDYSLGCQTDATATTLASNIATLASVIAMPLFGMLGVFFSRAMRLFARDSSRIDIDSYSLDFTGEIVRLRFLYGAVAALLLYILFRANMLSGDLFPDLDVANWPEEYGKLLIWAFTAGFSERLLPDLLPLEGKRAPIQLTPPTSEK